MANDVTFHFKQNSTTEATNQLTLLDPRLTILYGYILQNDKQLHKSIRAFVCPRFRLICLPNANFDWQVAVATVQFRSYSLLKFKLGYILYKFEKQAFVILVQVIILKLVVGFDNGVNVSIHVSFNEFAIINRFR